MLLPPFLSNPARRAVASRFAVGPFDVRYYKRGEWYRANEAFSTYEEARALAEQFRDAGYEAEVVPVHEFRENPARRRARPYRVTPRKPTEDELFESILINTSRTGTIGAFYSGKRVVVGRDMTTVLRDVREWMEREAFYPDIYVVNERGNIDHVSGTGEILASWV